MRPPYEPRVVKNRGYIPAETGPSRHIFKKLLVIVLLAVVMIAVYIAFNLMRLSANPFGLGKLKGESEGRVNILLLGVGDPGHAGQNLADTNMVVSVNTRDKQVALVSIPRDLRVRIPGYGTGKINQAHAQGGTALAQEVTEAVLGIPIHYYARANFSGLREAVDAVGGVSIEVEESLFDPEYPCDNNQYRSCGFRLSKGQQQMDGATALKYVRCRKGNCGDDFGRALRQQQVLQAVRRKALSLGTLLNPVRLNELSGALGDNITTDLSVNNILRLAKNFKDTNPADTINVVLSTAPNGFLISSSTSDLVPAAGNFSDIQNFVRRIFEVGPILAEKPIVAIRNGTMTAGLGGRLQQAIETDGYAITIAALANADRRDYATTQIIDYSGGTKPNTVKYLEGLLGVKATLPQATASPAAADITIILGFDYALSQNQ
ncbi:MAG TPA: LCP family protein [Candidatus Saccharimonadales bacterium]|nr:LCP family protein [Candidatus Saccharimonadales bacterium]